MVFVAVAEDVVAVLDRAWQEDVGFRLDGRRRVAAHVELELVDDGRIGGVRCITPWESSEPWHGISAVSGLLFDKVATGGFLLGDTRTDDQKV